MSRPAILSERLSDTLTLSECHADADRPRGWWLYDKTRGLNLAMGAPTRESALFEALVYYQKRLQRVETEHLELCAKVDAFIGEVRAGDNGSEAEA